jgi:hypothetical protein
MIEIQRMTEVVVCYAASSAATTSPRWSNKNFAGACVFVAHTGSATQVDWYAGVTENSPPRQVYCDGEAVTNAITVGMIAVPDILFAAPFVIPVVAGGTSCAMTVCKKG